MTKRDTVTTKRDIRSVYIPAPVWLALKIEAATTHSTVSELVREAIALRREKHERTRAEIPESAITK